MSLKNEFKRAQQNSCLGQAQINGDEIHYDMPFGIRNYEGDPNAVFMHFYAHSLTANTFRDLKVYATETLNKRIPQNMACFHKVEIINDPKQGHSEILAVIKPQDDFDLRRLYTLCQPIYDQFSSGDFGQPTRGQKFAQVIKTLMALGRRPSPKLQ